MRLAIQKLDGISRQFQRIWCNFGPKNNQEKRIWVNVTDKEYIQEPIYKMTEPLNCEACGDEGECTICEDDEYVDAAY